MVLQQRQINIHDSQSVNHPSGLTLSALYFSALCSLSAINYVSDLLFRNRTGLDVRHLMAQVVSWKNIPIVWRSERWEEETCKVTFYRPDKALERVYEVLAPLCHRLNCTSSR
jgi:hypothetical protein